MLRKLGATNPYPMMTLRTVGNLTQLTDLDAVHELLRCPEVAQYNTAPIPSSIEMTQSNIVQWILSHSKKPISSYTFSFSLKEKSEFIGLVGFNLSNKKFNRAEIWFKFHPDYWNQGYATEITKRIIAFGFDDLGLHRIQAGCAVDNIGSIRVLEKCGMKLEGRGRQVLPLNDGWSDNFEFSILESDPRDLVEKT